MSDDLYGAALVGLLLIPILGTLWDMYDTYKTLYPGQED